MILLWLCFCGLVLCCGMLTVGLSWRYYPTIKDMPLTPMTEEILLCWAGLCLTPVAMNIHAYCVWRGLHCEEAVT